MAAFNIANLATPAFKRRLAFGEVLGMVATREAGTAPASGVRLDLSPGREITTGRPLDIALLSSGFLQVRTDAGVKLSRTGRFHRDADGRWLDAAGAVLQAQGGGDLRTAHDTVSIAEDGVVIDGGEAAGRIGLVEVTDPAAVVAEGAGHYHAPADLITASVKPNVRQGAIEASNVSAADEMVGVMAALRAAQSAQRVVGVYDDLLARVITTIGQA